MKKTKLTLEQHLEMGAALKAFRNERLVKYLASIHNATRVDSPQVKAVRNALDAIDRLRNALDALACKDYGAVAGASVTRIYYGD